MSIFTSASAKSVYRGYEYFVGNKVLSINQINEFEYEGTVKGTAQNPYSVHLNIKKPKTSTCDCPFANGRRICKHMVALYFAVFPDATRQYKMQLENEFYEEEEDWEEEDWEAEIDDKIQDYIIKLSKSELQDILLQILYDGPEWQFDKFINEYIDW